MNRLHKSSPLKMIIAICGQKRSGKDTCAEYIINATRTNPQLFAMEHVKISDPLKKACAILFDLNIEESLEGPLKDTIDPRWKVSPRQIMQFVGTEMMQYKLQELMPDIRRNFWIKKLITNTPKEKSIVISDLRFVHEERMLRESSKNVFIIKVQRELNTSNGQDLHSSEQEWTSIKEDCRIINNSTIADLHILTDAALKSAISSFTT